MNDIKLSFVNTLRNLKNQKCSLTVDLFGGAYIGLYMRGKKTNPFNFRYSLKQMPWNNRCGSVFKGHFACIGRWGEPSLGEKLSGIPNHGDFCNILWNQTGNHSDLELQMKAVSKKEGLSVTRTIQMDPHEALFLVTESIHNINTLGRVFNIVQHPTFTAPFLDNELRIDCNAGQGFNQKHYRPGMKYQSWPLAINDNLNTVNINTCNKLKNHLFTYEVDPTSEIGWITIYSSTFNLLCGYVWKRSSYPWIHLWHHLEGNTPYMATEFGTAALDVDSYSLIKYENKLLNNSTYSWIDSGAAINKQFLFFSIDTNGGSIGGVENIALHKKGLEIQALNNKRFSILSSLGLYNESKKV